MNGMNIPDEFHRREIPSKSQKADTTSNPTTINMALLLISQNIAPSVDLNGKFCIQNIQCTICVYSIFMTKIACFPAVTPLDQSQLTIEMWSNATTGQSEGGFMDESYATTSGQPKDDRDANRSSNIIPMMIGHLKKCTRESKTSWDANIRFVCIVGIVRDITQATTKITYELEDETGTITAFKWLEADAPPPEDIVENQYARVFGSLREQNKKTHVFVLKITPVKLYAEVFSHLLEVLHMAMKKKKNSVATVEGGNANNDDDDDTCYSLTTEQKIIYKMIKSANNKDAGIERSELKAQVPPNLLSKVDNILEFLASEGHIYTTCTDDHFMAT